VTVRVDVEQIQATRTEKLLAVVLAAFLLLAGVWTYQRLDDVVRHHEPLPRAAFGQGAATQQLRRAELRLAEARVSENRALRRLVLRREAYRTALEAHRPAAVLGAAYDGARKAYADAQGSATAARTAVATARPAAEVEQRASASKLDAVYHRRARDTVLARLGLVGLGIVSAYLLLAWMRSRASRWFPLAGSFVAAATILALVLAGDYVTDYVDPFAWGVALIASLGIAATLIAYWTLQRYIARRLPQRRVRRGQCPFCGYPPSPGTHCEGCGRDVVAPCARCEQPRRVGTVHCAACGNL
jgi:hypothetical protein